MKRCEISGALLFLLPLFLLVLAAAPASAGSQPAPSLLELKLRLARDSRPYLHLTPEAFFVYFKTLLMRSLPLEKVDPPLSGPLEVSRIQAWAPPIERPILEADSDPEKAFDLLEVTDMPYRFVVLFEDETVWGINFAPEPQAARRREMLELLESLHPDPDRLPPDRMTQIEMSPQSAQELYWLLREGLGVIH